MGALGIELLDEIVESLLLLQQVVSCRTGSFGLQRAVHSLVSTVVLRMCCAGRPRRLAPGGNPKSEGEAGLAIS